MSLVLALLLTASAADAPPALERLARTVAEQTAKGSPEAPVAIFVEAPTPAMGRAFASLLASELAARKLSPVVLEAPSAAAAERSARDKDLRALVRVTLSAENTRIVARGDVLSTWVNFWSGAAATRAPGSIALAATIDADAQALALAALPPAPVTTATPLKLTLLPLAKLSAAPAAIAIGDLDGDKKAEVVVLTDDDLLVLAADGRVLGRADLRELPPSTRPTREPFGAVVVLPGKIAWLSGKRAHGEVTAWSAAAGFGKAGAATDEVSLDQVTVRLVPGLNAFAAEARWFGKPLLLPSPLTTTNTRGGVSLFLYANGTGALTRGVPPAAAFGIAPSAAVVADLDGDGTPELFASSPRFFPEGDEVRVVTVAAVEALAARGGMLSEAPIVWSAATPRGRVLAAAAGDLDGDGADDVVLGAWLADGTGELLVARKVAP